ncbi:class I SAM-dependent methyltransferase [Patescibacteria group bacterium]|nr:class I SAM-dependent methyltransferase [Patescibacteria group bacterium]
MNLLKKMIKKEDSRLNQEKIWDEISKVWKGYRIHPIPEVINFLKNQEGKILDLCCGSGRNLINTKGDYYGVDFSKKMISYAKEKAKEFKIKSNFKKSFAWDIPFDDNFFDSALFIDSLHCIKGSNLRYKTLKELFRVLKPGKKALITVWDKNQKSFNQEKKEVYVPWKINEKTLKRYYYLYDKNEILDLLKKVGFKINHVSTKEMPQKKYTKSIILIVDKPI